MLITLVNCKSQLQSQGINLTDNNQMGQKITPLLSWQSWDYNFDKDEMSITVQDSTIIPDLSSIGTVVTS